MQLSFNNLRLPGASETRDIIAPALAGVMWFVGPECAAIVRWGRTGVRVYYSSAQFQAN